MGTTFRRILAVLGGILIISYVAYHALVVPYTSIKTETALSFTAKETISVAETYIIRQENTVEKTVTGVYSYSVDNGSKVANGGTIANVYSDESGAQAKLQIEELDRQIENLEKLQSMSTDIVVSIDQIDKQLDSTLINILNNSSNGDYRNIGDTVQTYLTLLNRRLSVTGSGSDFSAYISELKVERGKLESSASSTVASVTAPCSGYFVSSVDGYEGVLNPDIIEDLTPECFDNISADKTVVADAYVGKVVSDMQWYIACKVSFDESLKFSVGKQLYLEIPTSTSDEVPVTVASINKSDDMSNAVVVFKCSYMNADLSKLRSPAVEIVMSRKEGLRVSKDAIKVEDGRKGVYVYIGSVIYFTPVEIIYDGNGYVVCTRTDPLEEGLHLYDDVVVKGKNLYDSKPVE